MYFLLATSLADRLKLPNVLTGLILAILGIALSFLAKKITQVIRGEKELKENDKIFLSIKAFALVMILVALILMVLQ